MTTKLTLTKVKKSMIMWPGHESFDFITKGVIKISSLPWNIGITKRAIKIEGHLM
jgi:hypothetical protein